MIHRITPPIQIIFITITSTLGDFPVLFVFKLYHVCGDQTPADMTMFLRTELCLIRLSYRLLTVLNLNTLEYCNKRRQYLDAHSIHARQINTPSYRDALPHLRRCIRPNDPQHPLDHRLRSTVHPRDPLFLLHARLILLILRRSRLSPSNHPSEDRPGRDDVPATEQT